VLQHELFVAKTAVELIEEQSSHGFLLLPQIQLPALRREMYP